MTHLITKQHNIQYLHDCVGGYTTHEPILNFVGCYLFNREALIFSRVVIYIHCCTLRVRFFYAELYPNSVIDFDLSY